MNGELTSTIDEGSEERLAYPLSDRLRRETSAAHAAIEESALLSSIFTQAFQPADYRHLLSILLGFYKPFEAQLFAGIPPDVVHDLGATARAPALAGDLATLGTLPEGCEADLRLLPSTSTLPEKIGALYVLEGAALGGQLIAKQILRRFGPDVASALSFYRGHGKHTALRWAKFRNGIDQLAFTAEERAIAVTRASDTFASLHRWIDSQASIPPPPVR